MREEKLTTTRYKHNALGGLLILCTVVAALIVLARQPSPSLPMAAVASAHGWADESQCIDCHDQATQFWQTGHAHTLQKASSQHSREMLAKLADAAALKAEQTKLHITDQSVVAVTEVDGGEAAVELDWCFGSGHHAATWVSTVADSSGATDILEFRWSLYAGDVVDVTPGQPEQPPSGTGKLGLWFDSPKAYRCFSCHASVLPIHDGPLPEAHIKTGVTCQRCHGPRLEHVLSDGSEGHHRWPADRWESVNRCAQCHRRADELGDDEVSIHNRNIVRFQPVGLVQSPCFLQSEMDCMTCHDPHKPLSAQDSRGIWQCVQCHDPDDDTHVLCGAGMRDQCLECHMPAIKMNAPVSFTDHWIRVRQPAGE